ncbi:hypothetical protein CW735_09820 [Alteromonas sp. MB-3u-76]|jgi:hypothetical protein|uniref:hypothetical protein n=1 Tax=Alteromonas sp. MB-3u-76 TaxID=2058133 RepID=UPI000C311651|nr:hypothetical protein [Alteromonas sp. MB-3u-76]AUC88442.1 hypothetical protein CW735_09820 [Alteromonas sp. MB-3u-76]
MGQSLTRDELIGCLGDSCDPEDKAFLDIAFQSIVRHQRYLSFHYEQFKSAASLHQMAMRGEVPEGGNEEPQFHRDIFEANAFAFFRCLHAVIDSVPYILNLILGDLDREGRVTWGSVKKKLTVCGATDVIGAINKLDAMNEYKQLTKLVNISKHRRLPRIDSGEFSEDRAPKFNSEELGEAQGKLNIDSFMHHCHDRLLPQSLEVLKSFCKFWRKKTAPNEQKEPESNSSKSPISS